MVTLSRHFSRHFVITNPILIQVVGSNIHQPPLEPLRSSVCMTKSVNRQQRVSNQLFDMGGGDRVCDEAAKPILQTSQKLSVCNPVAPLSRGH
jgi:hypothetical protein